MPVADPDRWFSILNFLDDLCLPVAFGSPGIRHRLNPADGGWESLTRLYFAEELFCRVEVDKLARQTARHGVLPDDISPLVRFYFLFRLECAKDFVGMLFPPEAEVSPFPDVPADWSDQQALEWLLIDLWVRRHDHWLKLNAIGARGPFAFYGLTKANPNT